jgi:hypothetical protein
MMKTGCRVQIQSIISVRVRRSELGEAGRTWKDYECYAIALNSLAWGLELLFGRYNCEETL